MSKEKEITIEDLARIMNEGFSKIEKNTDDEIESLALMVQNGFIEITKTMATKKEMADGFKETNERLETLEHKVNQIDRRLFSIEEDVDEIKPGKQKKLEERVTTIERKLGIKAAA